MPGPITYQLAESANYHFDIAKIGKHQYDHLSYYFKEDFPDIKIGRRQADMDIDRLQAHYLWTVNGYVYPSVVSDKQLYIPGGTLSMLRSRANKVGLLNLTGLGPALRHLSIIPSQVSTDVNMTAYEKVFLSFDEPVQSPILIMAGYLVFEHPEFFYRVSDSVFALRLNRLNYVHKLYELTRYRPIFEELGVDVSNHNPSHVDAAQLHSLETIQKFLSLLGSFVVDTGNAQGLQTSALYLENSTIPGAFRTHKVPTLPLFVGYGKLTEYHKQEINPQRYSVTVQDHVYNNDLFSARSDYFNHGYTDHRVVGATYRLSNAFFLDIRPKS